MKGCLPAPFRLAALLVVAAVVAGGWFYRDQLRGMIGGAYRRATGAPLPAQPTGVPGDSALRTARRALDRLASGRADSVVLDAEETASLLQAGFPPVVRARFDSLRVTLEDGTITVAASVRTGRLPADVLGPLALALHDREPVAAAGSLAVTGPGRAAWTVTRFRFRDFPLPSAVIPRLIGRVAGSTDSRVVPVALPAGARRLAVRRTGLVLYRMAD